MGYNVKELEEFRQYCQTCPELATLWSMSHDLSIGDNVIEIADVSNMFDVSAGDYVDGKTKITFKPTYPYTSTYYIVLYRLLYEEDNVTNETTQKNMDTVCKWFFDNQENGNVPIFTDEQCVKIELLTPRAIKRMAYEYNGQLLHDFYISVRLHKINPAKADVVVV